MPEAPPKQWQSPIDRTLSTFANMHPSDYPTPQATGLGGQASTSGSDLQDDNSLRARMEEEMKIALILNKNLSPDYIMTRPGGGGNKLSYIEAWQVVNIANEVFGFNGWYSEVKELVVDFCDCVESKGEKRYSVSVSAIVRVWLRSGGHGHEDVGCGSSVNQKSKSDAYQSAKKEAVTDGLKRAIRLYGNVLGNCIYDKNYCGKVSKMAKPPMKPFLASDLYYGPDVPDAPAARAAGSAASTSAAMAPPTVPQTRAQPQAGNATASTSRATPARAVNQQQPAKPVARVPVVPLPAHAAPQPRAPAVVAPVAEFEEGLFDNLDFSSQSMHEESAAHVGGGFEEADSGFAEAGGSGEDTSTLESNENDPSVTLSREADTSAADARAARLQMAQLRKQQFQLNAGAADHGHPPISTTSAAQMRSNNARPSRTVLRPAQPPARAQSHNPATNASHAGPSNAIGSTAGRQLQRTNSSGSTSERTVQAGQLPALNVGSGAGRIGGVGAPIAGGGFTTAARVKRNVDGSPGPGAGDGLNYGGSSGSRAPLGEVQFDSTGDVKRARYDH